MKLNKECVRKILFEIENLPYGDSISIESLHDKLKDFSIDDVLNAVTELNRNRFIIMLGKQSWDDTDLFRDNRIKALTDKGSRALDAIRDENVWNDIKSRLLNYEDISMYTILEIAFKIDTYNTNRLFDLPDNLHTTITRW